MNPEICWTQDSFIESISSQAPGGGEDFGREAWREMS